MRKFIIRFFAVLGPIYLVSLFYAFYIRPNLTGDLGRLGQIPFGKEYERNLQKKYLPTLRVDNFSGNESSHYNVVTIGDSFSQQGISGYQNYLASLENNNVLNIERCSKDISPEQFAVDLLNSAFFTKLNPRVVIVQSIERHFIFRLRDLNFKSNNQDNKQSITNTGQPTEAKPRTFLESMTSWIRLSCDYQDPVKEVTLKCDFFNSRDKSNKLYFYADDLLFPNISKSDIDKAKFNLVRLKDVFKSLHIQLIYVVAADKYDIYQSYIVDNKFPENISLNYFADFESDPFYLNTKKILLPLIQNKIEDVYLLNDSHWSYKGSKVVANELESRILVYKSKH